MKKILLISFAIFFVWNGESQTKNILRKNKYADFSSPEKLLNKLNKLTNLFNEKEDIEFYYEGETQSIVNNDSISLVKKRIGTKYNFYLYTYQYTPPSYTIFHAEYFEINHVKISIDSLLNKSHNNVIEKNPYLYFRTVSYLRFCKNDFILIGLENRNFNMNGTIFSYILIKMDKNLVKDSWLFYNGFYDERVFADFDNDGELDYLDWGVRKNRINLYNIKKDSLVKKNDKFIFVLPTKGQTQYERTHGISNDWYSIVDKRKSSWFFKF